MFRFHFQFTSLLLDSTLLVSQIQILASHRPLLCIDTTGRLLNHAMLNSISNSSSSPSSSSSSSIPRIHLLNN